MADELDVSIKDVYEMESRLQGQDIAFDPLDSDEEDSFAPSAWLVDENIDPARSTEREEQTHLMHRRLHLGLNKLDARSREIVETRWLNEDKATLQSLADKYQVSAERIRQIEQQALAELKTSISA